MSSTDELIEQLARGAVPVARVRPTLRASVWLCIVAASFIVMLIVMNRRDAIDALAGDGWRLAQQLAAMAVGVCAGFAAVNSVIPGRSRRIDVAVYVAAAAWIVISFSASLRDLQRFGTFGLRDQNDWPCVALMLVLSAAWSTVLIGMLRQGGAPLTPRVTALFAGLGAAALASVAGCFAHPHPYSIIVLVWHGATVALIAALFAWRGPRLLRWPHALPRD